MIKNNNNKLNGLGNKIGYFIGKTLRFIKTKNGIVICTAALVIILSAVIIGAAFSSDDNIKQTYSVSEPVSSFDTGDTFTDSTSEPLDTGNLDLEPEVPSSSTTDITAGERKLTLSEMEIPDTSWAYYIVNRSNPLPAEFEDDIEFKGVWSNGRYYYLDSRAADFAECMINDAAEDGVTLLICSAYRSYARQTSNFENRLREYASSKYSFSDAYTLTAGYIAVPGTSEHHTGLAVDFITPGYMYLDDGFEETDAYKWLSDNCYKYGFILRYPSDKSELTGINYEPWHFRFIGFEYAEKIHNSGLCLEEYMELDRETNPDIQIKPLGSLDIPAEPAWYNSYLNPPPAQPPDTSTDTSESVSESDGITDTSGAPADSSADDSTSADSAESNTIESDSNTTYDSNSNDTITDLDSESEIESESNPESESESASESSADEPDTDGNSNDDSISEHESEISSDNTAETNTTDTESVSESDTIFEYKPINEVDSEMPDTDDVAHESASEQVTESFTETETETFAESEAETESAASEDTDTNEYTE